MLKFKMFQVVAWDYENAYVLKHISTDEESVIKELAVYGDLEVLKVVELFPLSFESIQAYLDSTESYNEREREAARRFITDHFETID